MDSTAKPKFSYVVFGAGLLAGLLLGLLAGVVVLRHTAIGKPPQETQQAAASQEDEATRAQVYANAIKIVDVPGLWTDFPIEWKRLNPVVEAGQAPLTFETPAREYDYGAVSHPLAEDVVGEALILRVDVSDVKHKVGVSLVNPAGEPLRTEEQSVSEKDGKKSIFFRVTSKDLPAALLVRNYGDTSGEPGSITVNQVFYATEDDLAADQMDALKKIGLNQAKN